MEPLGTHPSERMEVMEDREVWRLNLELLLRNPQGKADNEERRRGIAIGNYFELNYNNYLV